jgi:hypothetical protein
MMSALIDIVGGDWDALTDDIDKLGLLKPNHDRTSVSQDLARAFLDQCPYTHDPVTNRDIPDLEGLTFTNTTTALITVALKYKFKLPPYYTLLARSLATLEGIALSADANFKITKEAFSATIRMLATDPRPEAQELVRSFLFTDKGDPKTEMLVRLMNASTPSSGTLTTLTTPHDTMMTPREQVRAWIDAWRVRSAAAAVDHHHHHHHHHQQQHHDAVEGRQEGEKTTTMRIDKLMELVLDARSAPIRKVIAQNISLPAVSRLSEEEGVVGTSLRLVMATMMARAMANVTILGFRLFVLKDDGFRQPEKGDPSSNVHQNENNNFKDRIKFKRAKLMASIVIWRSIFSPGTWPSLVALTVRMFVRSFSFLHFKPGIHCGKKRTKKASTPSTSSLAVDPARFAV